MCNYCFLTFNFNFNFQYIKCTDGFKNVIQQSFSLENVRDNVRQILHAINSEKFPMGQNNASVAELAFEIMKSDSNDSISQISCPKCDYCEAEHADHLGFVLHNSTSKKASSTQNWLSTLAKHCRTRCSQCSARLVRQVEYSIGPKLLVLEYPLTTIKTSHQIKVETQDEMTYLSLKGIVYHGGSHFASRIINPDGPIWYNDGIETGKNSILDGHLSTMSDDGLKKCRGKNLVLAVYGQEN